MEGNAFLKNTDKNSNLLLKIGDVFTPIKWGMFAVEEFGIFDQWIKGATVFDPTMGKGLLLQALVEYGLNKGYSLDELPIKSLYGNELNSEYHAMAIDCFRERYGIDMDDNFWNEDILSLKKREFDVVFGNPPWQNFVDLPEKYKEELKPFFFDYDLIGKSQKLLLGGARIDIAALIIQKAIKDFLSPFGNAYIFMPLSLLLNDGANNAFRKYSIHDISYAPLKVFDFNDLEVFPNVATRYGLLHFARDKKVKYPLIYKRHNGGQWEDLLAMPLLSKTSPLSVLGDGEQNPLEGFKPIEIDKSSSPRQGVNTCGANNIFFFTENEDLGNGTCKVDSGHILPSKYIYPLLVGKNFKVNSNSLHPKKWVLLPYNENGKPLELSQLKEVPLLYDHLFGHKDVLVKRKGTMIQGWIKRGYWWALLGIGPYNFFKYKIVWEAYGKKEFKPIIVKGNWQANQSLQAFIPVSTSAESQRVYDALTQPAVEAYLLSLKMEGTMNWAQPGRIKKLLKIKKRGNIKSI